MHRMRVLCAIGVAFWSAVAVGGQATPPVTLSPELRAHVQAERFQVVASLRGLPLGVREGLLTLFGSQGLDIAIAEPGATFQASGTTVDAAPPIRRLALAGCSYEHCLVYYERGGAPRTWRVALFHWRPEATRFEGGGTAPGGLKTIEDVRRVLLSGAIKGPAGPW